MHSHKILNISPANLPLRDLLSKQLGLSGILSQVLLNRGVKTAAEAERFLNIKIEHLLDPYQFTDMPLAVNRIKQAVRDREKVMVFSDYDVDGITSLALLKGTLSMMGLQAEHYLPHRIKEGYGLNKNIAHLAKQKHIKLLITADCGTNSHAEIKELRHAGIDVIVTDHHEPANSDTPEAFCVINPKVKGSGYQYADLAGVGVAYKLCQALTGKSLADELDLVALGTIADVVPLKGENRVIAKIGLERLQETRRAGLKALMVSSRIKDKKISATFVSFILGPRINASGRMDTAETSLSLLMSDDAEKAGEFARIIEGHNRQRQKIESAIMEEALAIIDKEVNFKEHKIIVVAKEEWHQGVLGIVAAKLADRFYRPTILISVGQHLCKGSGRSIKNFHLFSALLECGDVLHTFGGHSHAVGLVIERDNIKEFTKRINHLAKQKLMLEDLLPSLDIDMELSLADLGAGVVASFQALEPFGTGNPEPLFYTRNLQLKGEPQVLSRDTLKFWVSDGNNTCTAIGFGMGSTKDALLNAGSIDLVYSPRIDRWQGDDTVILEVKDIFFR